MAISVTEILGTDSIAGSRIVINDNFNIITDEINEMEVFFNPQSGQITNLNNLTTSRLTVGLSSTLMDVSNSGFSIVSDVQIDGDVDLQGKLLRDNVDPTLISDIAISPATTKNIGAVGTPPTYTIERVTNAGSTPITLYLFDGEIGQEIFFVYEGTNTGIISIQADDSADLVLPGGSNSIELDGVGQTAHLLSVNDGSGNPIWYLVGGVGYSLS